MNQEGLQKLQPPASHQKYSEAGASERVYLQLCTISVFPGKFEADQNTLRGCSLERMFILYGCGPQLEKMY